MSVPQSQINRVVRDSVRSILLATAASLTLGSAAMAVAPQGPKPFDIGGQPLTLALGEFAQQSNRQILYSTDVVVTKRTGGVRGDLTPESALRMLLQGTGLTFRVTADDTILVERAGTQGTATWQAADAPTLRLAQASSEPRAAEAPAEPSEPLEEVIVTGISFSYNNVESANKMNLSVKDTPQSVKVITHDMLDFAGITKFEDTYKIDAGSQTSNAQDGWVRTYFRGFRLNYDKALKIDGVRTPGLVAPDLSPFERFEIIKGPTSTLYGQAQVAGTLNAVSKKPRSDFGGSLSLETGSFSHYRGELDVYGALTADEKLTSRLVASYLDEDTFLDFGFNKRLVIAPSLRYQLTPQTAATLLVQYQHVELNGSYGYGAQYVGPVEGGAAEAAGRNDPNNYRWPDVPRSRTVGFPDANPDRELLLARGVLEHHFDNDWQLRGSALLTKSDVKNKGAYSGSVEPDGDVPLYLYFTDGSGDAYSGEVNLFGDVELMGRKHTLFFGADYSRDENGRLVGFNLLPPGSFNIFNPDYAALPPVPANVPVFLDVGGGVNRDRTLYQETGLTVQTLLHPTDRLSVLLGARYSDFKLSYISVCCDETALEPLPSGFGASTNVASDSDITFQFGSTYALTPNLNAYLSYGETFLPRNEFVASAEDPTVGVRTAPEAGKSYEIGLKGEALRRRFLWSVAAFEIERTNISEDDPNDNVFGFVVLRGKQRSRGLEVDFQGEVKPGWDVYGSLAVIDNKFTEGEFAGYSSFIAPKFGASLFSAYELQQGPLAGLGFGGGVVYKQRGEINQFESNGQGLFFDRLFGDTLEVDARVFYKRNPWTFQVSALNLFDSKYYSPVNNSFSSSVSVNPPRTILGKISYDFGAK